MCNYKIIACGMEKPVPSCSGTGDFSDATQSHQPAISPVAILVPVGDGPSDKLELLGDVER